MRALCVVGLVWWSLGSACLAEQPASGRQIPDALDRYVARPEPDFAWELVGEDPAGMGLIEEYRLTSQKWQGIVWQHVLIVYAPRKVEHPEQMLLFISGGRNGGRPREGDRLVGLLLAQQCAARVAILYQVPNQPLLGDHVEDDLITETWLKYLETGDETWPLLFPMVKSAVKAMDALQEISQRHWETKVEQFVLTGASKRGWTSWLTPVVDRRVIATAPMVIDTLNFPVQMRHQLEVWGKFSEQIEDYTRKGLVGTEVPAENSREARLWTMMDPYSYRSRLTLPKLLIVGTNDRYWVVNAMNNYWDDLEGPRYILQSPNSGHNLKAGIDQVVSTTSAFFRHAATGRALPQLDWDYGDDGERLHLRVRTDRPATAARLWTATSESKDFRESEWTSRAISGRANDYAIEIARETGRQQAVFAELQFHEFGLDFSLTTLVYTTVPRERAAAEVEAGQ